MTIYFFSKGEEQYRFLSNFHPCQIEWEGEIWPSAEHLYQGLKYSKHASTMSMRDDEPSVPIREQIRQLPTAAATKRFAKGHKDAVRPDWNQVKVKVMWDILYQKFTQNPDLRQKLDATRQEKLVEDSPWDSFWGSGRDGRGLNQLGVLLMELRAELRKPVGYPE